MSIEGVIEDLRDQVRAGIMRVDFNGCESALLDDLSNLKSAISDYLQEVAEYGASTKEARP